MSLPLGAKDAPLMAWGDLPSRLQFRLPTPRREWRDRRRASPPSRAVALLRSPPDAEPLPRSRSRDLPQRRIELRKAAYLCRGTATIRFRSKSASKRPVFSGGERSKGSEPALTKGRHWSARTQRRCPRGTLGYSWSTLSSQRIADGSSKCCASPGMG